MIDLKKLRELVKLMRSNDLTELDLQDEKERITLKRSSSHDPVRVISPMPPPQAAALAPPGPGSETIEPRDEGIMITSPMVGTFYAASSPEAEPFVHVGDTVDPDTVVCIVEAMKVFNEIRSETNGTIQKILVTSGQAVEFGQPLFLVKPG